MFQKILQKLNKERGSATVEAVVAFTGFILVIFTVLSLVNLCRTQMLISSAMDNAAKELSQYAYFYKMSGLKDFSESLGKAASVGKEDINGVIGSVDGFYGSMVGAIDKTQEGYTNIAEATKEGTLEWTDVETALNGVDSAGKNVETSMNNMMSQFEAIGDNPMAYMKSLVAIAGSKGLDMVKSHLIAAPLAKMYMRQQFGGRDNAQANLENMGVKGGLDGMNFHMSTIFTEENPEDIHLVVLYEVQLLQLFDWEILEVKLCKHARTGAWLGGDNVQEIVDPTKATTPPATGGATDPSGGATNPSGGATDPTGGATDPTGGATEPPTEPSTEPTEPPISYEGSYWHLGDGGYGVEDAGVDNAFRAKFIEDYHIDKKEVVSKAMGYNAQDKDNECGWAYSFDYNRNPKPQNFGYQFIISELMNAKKQVDDGELPEGTKSFVYVVYVPENIPESQLKELREAYNNAWAQYQEDIFFGRREPIGDGFLVDVDFEPAGGNYDYSSGG